MGVPFPAVETPTVLTRSGVVYVDLRRWGGSRHYCLRLPAGSSDLEIGIATGRAIEALRLAGTICAPELPGLERKPGQPLSDVVTRYLDSRDFETVAGARFVRGLCGRISRQLGHMEIAAFDGHAGDVVVRAWRERLWAQGCSGHTTNNYLKQFFAILRWAKSHHLLTGLPDEPRACRPGEALYTPVFDHWTEGDFRVLRDHWADAALEGGNFGRAHGSDRAVWLDYVAKRKLYLSLAYYTGMHTADLDRARSDWLSWEVGRYRRENTKSARCIRPAVFDMPEQLRLDCEEEVRRLGRPWRAGELVAGGPWGKWNKTLHNACRRLWPEEPTRPSLWTFRLARRSTAWEYTIRGWSAEQIAEILGHIDRTMVDEVYRRCSELALISPVRLPWNIGTAPRGEPRTSRARVLPFAG